MFFTFSQNNKTFRTPFVQLDMDKNQEMFNGSYVLTDLIYQMYIKSYNKLIFETSVYWLIYQIKF